MILNKDDVSGHEELSHGPYIQLSIIDSGTGMKPDIMSRVFEPFFTTKDVGEGTGLGLSMVYGFIKQCGGHVSLLSEPGEGTTVLLLLPQDANGTVDKAVVESVSENTVEHGGQILIVEDDADVRRLAVRLLDQLGYRSVQAENGKQALQLLGSEAGIELLFSDVALPGGMSGTKLAEEATRINPALKVLLTSGYTSESVQPWETSGYRLLEKPYTQSKLAGMLSQALAQESSPPG